MRGIKSVALLCTLALGAPAFSAGLTKTLPGDLTTAQAQAVVQASMKKAREIKVPMNIAVMDAGGNLKAFARMDDAFIGSIDIAQKKAKTARYFNMSTRDLGKASQPGIGRTRLLIGHIVKRIKLYASYKIKKAV